VFGCSAPDTGNAEIIATTARPSKKEQSLRRSSRRDVLVYSYDEPHAGADPTMFTTRAEKDATSGHQRLEVLSSNARTASFLIVMAVSNPEISAYQGMSMFLVPPTLRAHIGRNVGLAGRRATKAPTR